MDNLEANVTEAATTTVSRPGPQRVNGQKAGLRIVPRFCPEDVADPFDTVEWDSRTATIKGEGGEVLFEQNDCEIPKAWSQLATNVVANKYLYGEVGTRERETGSAN